MNRTKKQKKLLWGGIGAVIAAAALIGGGIWLAVSDSGETVTPGGFSAVGEEDSATACQNLMSSYYTAIMSEDAEALYDIMAPEEYWAYYIEEYGKSKEAVIATYDDAIKNTKASWQAKCGSDAKISFKIDASGEVSEEVLTQLSETVNASLGEGVYNAEEGMTLSVTQTVKGSSGTDETVNTPTLIKVNGKWYILDEGIGASAN